MDKLPHRNNGDIRGFTLIEAMITLSVMATLLAIGMPSYQGFVQRQRVNSAMHLLTAHMASARMTAITHRVPTVVCPSNGNGGCRTDGDWTHGWLMFTDRDGNRRPDLPKDILRDERAPIHGSLRIMSSSGRSQLRYQPTGYSHGSNLTIRICQQDRLLGTVIVNNAGRIRSARSPGSRPCMG